MNRLSSNKNNINKKIKNSKKRLTIRAGIVIITEHLRDAEHQFF